PDRRNRQPFGRVAANDHPGSPAAGGDWGNHERKTVVRKTRLGMILVLALGTLALALAPAAMAQSSSVDGYGGQGDQLAGIAAGTDPGTAAGAASDSSSTLPFTGLDVSLLIGGGLLLLGIGIVMTRMVPRRHEG
ncbi:MAG: hypothetical protein U0R26_12205, partial [Solirubrobacterales bacterium]